MLRRFIPCVTAPPLRWHCVSASATVLLAWRPHSSLSAAPAAPLNGDDDDGFGDIPDDELVQPLIRATAVVASPPPHALAVPQQRRVDHDLVPADAQLAAQLVSEALSLTAVLAAAQPDDALIVHKAVDLSKRLAPHLAAVSAADAAACFDALQRAVESAPSLEKTRHDVAATTRLREEFIRDVAYKVFQADVQAELGPGSAAGRLSASTLRHVIAAGYVNDDYLTGIGLARCAVLVDEMDAHAVLHTLEALRRFDRSYFSFAEAEHYRRAAAQGSRQGVDLTVEEASKAGAEEDGDDDLAAGGVVHPNLISVISSGLEARLHSLIDASLHGGESVSSGGDGAAEDKSRVLMLTGAEAETVIDISDASGDAPPQVAARNSTAMALVATTSTRRDASSNRGSSSVAFAPLCRPKELIALVRELCQCPGGVSDASLWDKLAEYLRRHNDVAMRLMRQRGAGGINGKPRLSGSRPLLQLPLPDLMSLLHVLVKPILAMHDPLDAIIAANSRRHQREGNDNNNSLVLADDVKKQLVKLPTQPVIAQISALFELQCRSMSTHGVDDNNLMTIIGRRDPDAMRDLRRAFEIYPVLFETAPELWDRVRTARIPKRNTAAVVAARAAREENETASKTGLPRRNRHLNPDITGVDNRNSMIGRLVHPARMTGGVKRELNGPVASRYCMRTPNLHPGERKRNDGPRQQPRFLELQGRGGKTMKEMRKARKWSKGAYRATRLAE